MTLLSRLDAVNWSSLSQAYGPATHVPEFVRELVSGNSTQQQRALEQLWSTVCHQGTVYDCTPAVVPFLLEVVRAAEVDARTRAGVAILLADIGSAATAHPAGHDLAERCTSAIGEGLDGLATTFTTAPRAVRAGLVALFATVAEQLPASLIAELRTVESDIDARLATAARLVAELVADEALNRDRLRSLASVDGDALDYLSTSADEPIRRQAVEIAIELAGKSIG